MKCEACDKAQATVHLTEIVNKKKRELHLCEECAREKGVSVKAVFSADLAEKPHAKAAGAGEVTGAIEKAQPSALQRVDDLASTSCPVCGLTFAEFRASGRLGCANDYMAFKKGLVPLLEKIHGSVEHRGKVPAHVGERIERQRKVAELRQKLNAAIQKEEYEVAASLRDEIYKLEDKGKG
ncbi:MAG TPA: UvrB/UvrC motif-containing protein [Planctomycetota bacterium]|nr:UvrB/UvrC motif-containing protein [Planctomycetota bacterium]